MSNPSRFPRFPLVCRCGRGCADWDDFWVHQDQAHGVYIPLAGPPPQEGPKLPRWYELPKTRHSRDGSTVKLKDLDDFYRRYGKKG